MKDVLDPTLYAFIEYNNWANAQLLEACEALSPEYLALPCEGAYGSISDTLAHIIRGESRYVELLTGERPQPDFDWNDGPSVTQMRAFNERIAARLLEVAATVPTAASVTEEDDGATFRYKATVVYIQIVNHGIEHRTNITTVLNQQGLNPPGIDGWGYLNAHGERFDLQES